MLRKKVTVPPLKEGHRYRLRVYQRAHVGNGGGYGIWINGKPMIENRDGIGRGGGEKPYGAYITKEWLDDFAKGEVTIAVKSFLRYNDKYNMNPTKPEPQGLISIDIEEQKLPPMGDDLVRQSAKHVGMLSSEWQAAQFSESDEERQQAPQIQLGWQVCGQSASPRRLETRRPDGYHRGIQPPPNQAPRKSPSPPACNSPTRAKPATRCSSGRATG